MVENVVSVDKPRKESSQEYNFWLRDMPLSKSITSKEENRESLKKKLDSLKGYSEQLFTRKSPLECKIQDSASTTHNHIAKCEKVETSDCSSIKKILGFSIDDSPAKNSLPWLREPY